MTMTREAVESIVKSIRYHDYLCNVGDHNIHTELVRRGCNCPVKGFVDAIMKLGSPDKELVAALTDIRGLHTACNQCALTSGEMECTTHQIADEALIKLDRHAGKGKP